MGNHKVLKTSNAVVRYSMYDFIDFVRQEQVLWNHKSSQFHNREHREEGWRQVARRLCDGFDALQQKEQRLIIDTLMKRWKNARDSFLRAHRLKQSDNGPNYIYDKEMEFLLACGFRRDSSDAPAKDSATATPTTTAATATAEKPARSSKARRCTTGSRTKVTTRKRQSSAALAAASTSAKRTQRSSPNLDQELDELCMEVEEQLRDDTSDDDEDAPARGPEKKPTATTAKTTIVEAADTWPAKTDVDGGGNQHSSNASQVNDNSGAMFLLPTTHACSTYSGGGGGVGGTAMTTMTAVEHDADQAFFDSIKPVIRAMSVDQKLDFQIALLKLLKNFRTT